MQVEANELSQIVRELVGEARVVDLHTHLYPPMCEELFLRGIDDLLTYHYLLVETLRYGRIKPTDFFALSKEKQADEVWKTLFVDHSPVSEACRGVLTVLKAYGIDAAPDSLDEVRAFFRTLSPAEHADRVFATANLDYVVMTNDAFDPVETAYWGPDFKKDKRFRAALRIDPLLNTPDAAMKFMRERGYEAGPQMSAKTAAEMRRFLADNADQIDPLYLAASLPPSFRWKDGTVRGQIMEEVIVPFCQERNIPAALMIGVRKLVNPDMRLGGDSLGKCSVESLEEMCLDNPDVRFLITLLSRENQHELCVAARKFPNLKIFGCWWFLNNPSLVKEITEMRMEMLGVSFIPQHSDARVLDQLIYKWAHSKAIIADVLIENYSKLLETGWSLSKEDIKRDIDLLFSGNANEALGL